MGREIQNMQLDHPPKTGDPPQKSKDHLIRDCEVDQFEKDLGIKSTPLVLRSVRNKGVLRELDNLSSGINYNYSSYSKGSRPARGSKSRGSRSCQ